MTDDIQRRLTEQQGVTANNLHHIALGILNAKESVEEGNFTSAHEQLKLLVDSVSFTATAVKGLALVREAQDI